jgi:hypothetical protein
MKEEQFVHRTICGFLASNYPEVLFTTDLSGVRLHEGLRKQVAGLRSCRGIPDLLILHPACGCHGLLLEIKGAEVPIFCKNGLLRADPHLQEQHNVISRLKAAGYAAFFVRGIDNGRNCVTDYMRGRMQAEQLAKFVYE